MHHLDYISQLFTVSFLGKRTSLLTHFYASTIQIHEPLNFGYISREQHKVTAMNRISVNTSLAQFSITYGPPYHKRIFQRLLNISHIQLFREVRVLQTIRKDLIDT